MIENGASQQPLLQDRKEHSSKATAQEEYPEDCCKVTPVLHATCCLPNFNVACYDVDESPMDRVECVNLISSGPDTSL